MDGPGLAKTTSNPIPERWKSFAYPAPLLLECLKPLFLIAPELLERQPIIDAVLAVYLVNRARFEDADQPIPEDLTDKQVARTWGKLANFWFKTNDRNRTLRYRRFNGQRNEVWPILEIVLRTLVPDLPSQINPISDFKLPAMQEPGIKAFLLCIALILGIVTRRQKRSKP